MDIFDRLQYIVDQQGDKDLAEFSRKSNVKYETLRGILKYRRSKPGYEVLKNIIENIEWVDPNWLMTGRGDPKKKEDVVEEKKVHIVNNSAESYLRKEDRLLTIIESQQRTIENLSKNDQKRIAGSA